MKITIYLKYLELALIFLYGVLLFIPNIRTIWFSTFLIMSSIPLFIKSLYFLQDSKLWLASLLLQFGIFGVLCQNFKLTIDMIYPMYVLIFGFSSFLVFVIFRQKIHLKVFVICVLEVVLLGIFKFEYISLVEFLFLQIVFLTYIIFKLLERLIINFRSN